VPNVSSTLTITLREYQRFALTQSNFSETLPSGLTIKTTGQGATPQTATTCTGAAMS
jgi:hypothetical protein